MNRKDFGERPAGAPDGTTEALFAFVRRVWPRPRYRPIRDLAEWCAEKSENRKAWDDVLIREGFIKECRCGDDPRNVCSSCRPSPPDHEPFCGVHFGSVSCTCGLALGGAAAE